MKLEQCRCCWVCCCEGSECGCSHVRPTKSTSTTIGVADKGCAAGFVFGLHVSLKPSSLILPHRDSKLSSISSTILLLIFSTRPLCAVASPPLESHLSFHLSPGPNHFPGSPPWSASPVLPSTSFCLTTHLSDSKISA